MSLEGSILTSVFEGLGTAGWTLGRSSGSPAFETAIMRLNNSDAPRDVRYGSDTLTIRNLPLVNLMIQAFLLTPDQEIQAVDHLVIDRVPRTPKEN